MNVLVAFHHPDRSLLGVVQGEPIQAGGNTWLPVRFFVQDDPSVRYGALIDVRMSEVIGYPKVTKVTIELTFGHMETASDFEDDLITSFRYFQMNADELALIYNTALLQQNVIEMRTEDANIAQTDAILADYNFEETFTTISSENRTSHK